MEIILKKNLCRLVNRYDIKDINNRKLLRIEKKVLTLSNKHLLTDLTENPLATIQRKIFSILPRYIITFPNGEVISVVKKTTSLRKRYVVMDSEGEYTIEGNVIENNFVIKKDDEELAKVEKTIVKLFKAYDIQIKDVKNIPKVLAIVITLDIVKYKRLAYIL